MRRTLEDSHLKSIYLVGFSGSGKSTIGPMLARKLRCKYFDTDEIIEKLSGKSIAQIFDSRGEERFRKYETEVIKGLIQKQVQEKVVALGGGAFELMRNRKIIADDGFIIYLSCPIRILQRRLLKTTDRPLLAGKELTGALMYQKIRRIVLKRKPNYQKADLRLSTGSETAGKTTNLISDAIKNLHGNS